MLVNLLVAMFTDTYNKVFNNSEIEYKYQKYARIFLYKNVAHRIPPPFNVFILLPQLMAHYLVEWSTMAARTVGVGDAFDENLFARGSGAFKGLPM